MSELERLLWRRFCGEKFFDGFGFCGGFGGVLGGLSNLPTPTKTLTQIYKNGVKNCSLCRFCKLSRGKFEGVFRGESVLFVTLFAREKLCDFAYQTPLLKCLVERDASRERSVNLHFGKFDGGAESASETALCSSFLAEEILATGVKKVVAFGEVVFGVLSGFCGDFGRVKGGVWQCGEWLVLAADENESVASVAKKLGIL